MSIRLFPYHEDLLATAAARTLQQAAAQLPDLSSVVILVADTLASNSLRTTLCAQAQQAGHAALLGLRITTLRDWIESSGADDQPPLNEPARHLLLVEALRQHSGLFGEDDPWRVADSLLGLFDELSLHRAQLPASEAALAERLAQGYRISGP
ncbi:MAG: DNA helicase, partial [Gammaproteobacteria bacterium]|nr:DNA helicase [Gammaproteobacteria bacterium]